jgi:hypothetical protein
MIFFSYLTDFSYFCTNEKSKSYRIWSERVKNDILKGGVDGFSYFSMIFSYFIF